MIINLFKPLKHTQLVSVSLLIVRIVTGSAFVIHGWQKIQNPLEWMGAQAFIPSYFQFLAATAEFLGGIGLIVGFLTPLASLGIAITMVVAIISHIVVFKDPFVNLSGGSSFELAASYLSIALLLLLSGPGKYSVDNLTFKERL